MGIALSGKLSCLQTGLVSFASILNKSNFKWKESAGSFLLQLTVFWKGFVIQTSKQEVAKVVTLWKRAENNVCVSISLMM